MGKSHFWKIQSGEVPPPPIAQTLNFDIQKTDVENRQLTCAFSVDDRYLNPAGMVQGGILSAMLDAVLGQTTGMMLGEDQFPPTLDLNVSFIKAAKAGKFVGVGSIVEIVDNVCYASAELFNSKNQLIARATATMMIIHLPSHKK